jgi:hypothetical protein
MADEDDLDMGYASGDLQRGAMEQAAAAESADGLARRLAGLHLDAAALGTMRSAVIAGRRDDADVGDLTDDIATFRANTGHPKPG